MLDAGADFYLYDGHLPCNLWIIDETALIKVDCGDIGTSDWLSARDLRRPP